MSLKIFGSVIIIIIIIFHLLLTKFTDKAILLHVSCLHYIICGATLVFNASILVKRGMVMRPYWSVHHNGQSTYSVGNIIYIQLRVCKI